MAQTITTATAAATAAQGRADKFNLMVVQDRATEIVHHTVSPQVEDLAFLAAPVDNIEVLRQVIIARPGVRGQLAEEQMMAVRVQQAAAAYV
jgi:hypothetical protein